MRIERIIRSIETTIEHILDVLDGGIDTQNLAPQGTLGQVLTSNGADEQPTWENGSRLPVRTITDSVILDAAEVVLVDATAAAIVVALPPVAGRNGQRYEIKKIDASVNQVSIEADGLEQIEFSGGLLLTAQGHSRTVVCDGSAWYVI